MLSISAKMYLDTHLFDRRGSGLVPGRNLDGRKPRPFGPRPLHQGILPAGEQRMTWEGTGAAGGECQRGSISYASRVSTGGGQRRCCCCHRTRRAIGMDVILPVVGQRIFGRFD